MGPMIQLISGINYLIVLGYGGIMVISAAITLGELVASTLTWACWSG